MWIRKLFFSVLLLSCGWVQAQTVWPAVQSNMYPYIPNMKLVRHEQTVLLGEANQQTGIFYASLTDTYSEQVSNELINDALLKSWSLHSLVRLGTSFVLTFVQDTRILDIGSDPNRNSYYSYDYAYLTPGQLADLGYNPNLVEFQNGMVIPVNSGTLGNQFVQF